MAKGIRYKVKPRRRREGKTDYKRRLALVKSGKPRLVARVSNNQIVAQIIEYSPKGDKTLVNTTSLELKKYGWSGHGSNIPAAYLTGLLCGVKAAKKGVKDAVFDIGLRTPVKGSRVYAVLKGAIDSGLAVPHSPDIFPSDERILGKSIAEYQKKEVVVEDVKKKIIEGKK